MVGTKNQEEYLQKTISTYNKVVRPYIQHTKDLLPLEELERFSNLIETEGLILDAGCGWGRDSKHLVKKGFRVQGIDLSEKMIEIATKYVPDADFSVNDLRELDFKADKFDGIWANAVLYHLKQDQAVKALQEFKRVLKPGGLIFSSVKRGSKTGMKKSKFVNNQPRFIAAYEEDEFKALFQELDFVVLDCYTVYEQERWSLPRNRPLVNIFAKI
jgi:2-polyprenyl-3-methyl-5-hydroxy-6-metoxy-1,4-benzoquinol methylase